MTKNQQIVTKRELSVSLRKQLDALGFTGGSVKSDLAYFQQTHLGPDGKPLPVTGDFGTELPADLAWALKHPTGKAQKSNLEPKIPRGLHDDRRNLLEWALAEHAKGVKERPNGSNRSKDIDKYFPKWLRNKLKKGEKGPAWCAFFVNAAHTAVLGHRPWGGYIGSCKALLKAAQKSDKCLVTTDSALAAPGDIFLIIHGATGHTGLVLRKNKQCTKINTVEGNCGNRVKVGLRETKDIGYYIKVLHDNPAKRSSPLLKAADVGKAGTR